MHREAWIRAARLALRRLALAAFAFLLAVLAELPLAAGDGVWTPVGPTGGSVTALAMSPSTGTIYAATANGGVFKRATSRGGPWVPARAGLPTNFYNAVLALALAPVTPDVLYASTATALSRSADGGASWSRILGGEFFPVAVAPRDPATVYVIAESVGIGKSTDGGASWQFSTQGLTFPYLFNAIAVDPRSADTAYVAGFGIVFKTTDGGGHWTPAGPMPRSLDVASLTIDAADPDTVYVAGRQQILRSADGGASWTDITPDPNFGYGPLALAHSPAAPSSPGAILYAAAGRFLFGSLNGGTTWTRQHLPAMILSVAADPADPGHVEIGLDGLGVWRSLDGGHSWRPANRGLRATTVTLVAADPHVSGSLYVADESGQNHESLGVRTSRDGGVSWSAASGGPALAGGDPLQVSRIVVDPRRAGALYALTISGLFASGDGGASWQRRAESLAGHLDWMLDMAFDPRNPNWIYLVRPHFLLSIHRARYLPSSYDHGLPRGAQPRRRRPLDHRLRRSLRAARRRRRQRRHLDLHRRHPGRLRLCRRLTARVEPRRRHHLAAHPPAAGNDERDAHRTPLPRAPAARGEQDGRARNRG
ncbi:MAG TPA: hypothetical protein VHR45_08700 [Thermoanaerobaculia bacterium]|nr:hypothetical protein [Thermoanaerobaculia bacterium]